jgi:hypothetical protein
VRRTRPAAAFHQRGDDADLEGAADFVERVAMETHDAASLGDVAEFIGQLQQRELAFDTLRKSGHSGFSGVIDRVAPSIYPEARMVARLPARGQASNSMCRKIIERLQLDQSARNAYNRPA